jgi:hypothetical protein
MKKNCRSKIQASFSFVCFFPSNMSVSQPRQKPSQQSTKALVDLTAEALSAEITRIKKMKWGERTTEGYTRAFVEFAAWLSGTHPEMIDATTGLFTSNLRASALIEFCTLRKKAVKDPETKKTTFVNLSFSTYNGYKSAVKWGMKKINYSFPPDEETELKDFFSSLKKRTAKEKQDGEREIEEGKREMPWDVYEALAKYFWASGLFFELAYLTLTWNLCCRTNNTEGIKMCHLSWHDDALKVFFFNCFFIFMFIFCRLTLGLPNLTRMDQEEK